jgi:HD-GYP domain-containing protein (c-di-GMP phosphodiesterase class II)
MSDSDLKVLQIIANQSAIAIDKAQLYKTLKEEYLNTIRVLATAVEVKDAYTEGHSFRVSKMAKLIARKLSNSEKYIEEIEISGILHDIGKIGIFDKILTKKGKLTDQEFSAIQQHPEIGYKIINPINLSQPIIDGILLHHKRFDLKGYPKDIQIVELPLAAGIIGVADAVDAMTSTRSYSGAKDIALAMLEVEKHSGTQFHPSAASAILAIFRETPEKLLQIINEDL